MFDVRKFNNALDTERLGRHFWYFREIASTNAYIKTKDNNVTAHGLACLADGQNDGRGLYGKNWDTEPGKNLTFTLVFKPKGNDCLQTLSLVSALSVSEVLQEITGLEFYLKWPNDIYYEKRKLGGILTETSYTGNTLDRIIIGIGLNINQTLFNGELKEKACSLSSITGRNGYSREELLARILIRIEQKYNAWENKDPALIRNINRKLYGYGKWVRLQVEGKVLEGRFKLLGVNNTGFLYTLNDDDELKVFTHEEVRVKGNAG